MTSNELENPECHQLQPLFEHWVDLSAIVENVNEQDDEDTERNNNSGAHSSSSKTTILSGTRHATNHKILTNKFEYSDSIENLTVINSLINNQLQNLQNNNNNNCCSSNNNSNTSAATTSKVHLKISPAMHNIAIPDLSLIPNTDLRLLRIDSKKLEKTLSSSSSTNKFHRQSSGNRLEDQEDDVGGNGENILCDNSSDNDSVGKDSHKKDTLSLCSSASSHDISNCGSDEGSFHGNIIPTSSIGNCRKKFRSSSVQCSKRCDSPNQKDHKGRGNYVTTTKMTPVKRNFRR